LNNEKINIRRSIMICIAISAIGFVFRLALALSPFEFQIHTFLADDAFYYLGIAHNLASSGKASFDGITSTNGFHPLWTFILTILDMLGLGWPSPKAGLIVLAFFGSINTFLIGKLAGKAAGPTAAIIASIFWALNPFVIIVEMMGVEAPLAVTFMLAATLFAIALPNQNPSGFSLVRIGFLVGLAFLARTDTGFFALLFAAWFAYIRPKGQKFRDNAIAGLAAFAVVLPWISWCFLKFGSVIQDSGRAIHFRAFSLAAADGTSALNFALGNLHRGFWDYLIQYMGFPHPAISMLFLGACFTAILALRKTCVPKFFRTAFPPALHGLIAWAFYSTVFGEMKAWYFVSCMMSLALFAGVGVSSLITLWIEKTDHHIRTALILGILLIALFAAGAPGLLRDGLHPWQTTYLKVAKDLANGKIKDALPEYRPGAFNAGILAAVTGRQVINLDGVVNHEMMTQIRSHRFLAGMKQLGVKILIDHEDLIVSYKVFSESEFFSSFRLLARYPTGTKAGDILVLEVQ